MALSFQDPRRVVLESYSNRQGLMYNPFLLRSCWGSIQANGAGHLSRGFPIEFDKGPDMISIVTEQIPDREDA